MNKKQQSFTAFVKNNKLTVTVGAVGLVLALALVVGAVIWFTQERDLPADKPQMSITEVFGTLFGLKVDISDMQEASVMEGSRPMDNMDIPFEETKLARAFDMLDKRHLYIGGKSHTLTQTGYMTVKRVYAFNDNDIYIMLDNGVEDYHLVSDGKQVVGLDFEKSTYTVTSPFPYTIDQLLFTGGYEACTSTGTDTFLNEQKIYEDFTTYSTKDRTEWIRYFFNEDDSLAGYVRYVDNDIIEIMDYTYIGSDFPEGAVVFFDIPSGFTEEDIIIDYSDLLREW